MQKRYQNNDEILVIAGVRHKNGNTKIITEYVKSKKVPDLQVYLHFKPLALGIKEEKDWGLHGPWFAITDSSGKIAFHTTSGRKLGSVITRLLKETSLKGELFPGVLVKHNKSFMEKFKPGLNVSSILNRLKILSSKETDAGKEAKEILNAFHSWKLTKISSIKRLLGSSPLKAHLEIKLFSSTMAGLQEPNPFLDHLKAIKTDPNISNGIRVLMEIEQIKLISSEHSKNRKVQSIISKINSILKFKKIPPLMREEYLKIISYLEGVK